MVEETMFVEITKECSLGKEEEYCEWFYCPGCDYSGISEGDNYCGGCGLRIVWNLERVSGGKHERTEDDTGKDSEGIQK